MIKKELEELRKRLNPGGNEIERIVGCYVNGNREIVSTFDQSILTEMTDQETERMMNYFKKVLSGTPNVNQLEILFRTDQVAKKEPCYQLLEELRSTHLRDEAVCRRLYETIASSFDYKKGGGKENGNYMILLIYDCFPIPVRQRGAKKADAPRFTGEDFEYILCAICPAKELPKGSLNYSVTGSRFEEPNMGWLLDGPLAGFVFPAFDHRTNNIYMAGFYTKKPENTYVDLLRALFDIQDEPTSTERQKQLFEQTIMNSLGEQCDLDTYYKMTDKIRMMEMEERQAGNPQLKLGREAFATVMENIGVEKEKVYSFLREYNTMIGEDRKLMPRVIMDLDKVDMEADEVSIRCNLDQRRRISTRVIDGKKCVVIEVEHAVMVNGLPLEIT